MSSREGYHESGEFDENDEFDENEEFGEISPKVNLREK